MSSTAAAAAATGSADVVYKSAADIFAKQQRDQYTSILDALTKLLLEHPAGSGADALDEQRLRFFFSQVLPLLFDDDAALQGSAIAAMEALLPHVPASSYDQLPDWPAIKDTISEQYCRQVNALRDRHHSQWHSVWSILVRLIHRDILRSATLINRYLSIVEQGFRNANLTVRAEAFLCWRVLVEMFARHGELLAPKRIKLVCIPLKSSQSKTEAIAVNKFAVWWYLMSEVHDRLVEYTDSIVEPFLIFCFGPLGIQPLIGVGQTAASPITAPGKTFEKLSPMVVGALVGLLGVADAAVSALLADEQLPPIRQPFHSGELFARIGKVLINSAGEATVLIAKMCGSASERREPIAGCLWRLVADRVNELRCYDHFNLMLDNIYALENCASQHANMSALAAHIVHTVATRPSFVIAAPTTAAVAVESPATAETHATRLFTCIQRICLLLLSATISYTPAQIDDVLRVWLNTAAIATATGHSCRDLTRRLLKFSSTARPATPAQSPVRLAIWQHLCDRLLDQRTLFADAGAAEAEVLLSFVLAPIGQQPQQFDEYRDRWLQVARHVCTLDGVADAFARRGLAVLRTHSAQSAQYNAILAGLLDAERADFEAAGSGAAPVELLLDHVDQLCAASTAATHIKDLNVVAHAVNGFARRLDGARLLRVYRRLKATVGRLEATVASMRCDRAVCGEFRTAVAAHVRKHKPTQKLIRELADEALKAELLELQSADSEFVIIPSVWKFNPDRLTDQQRDKMRERRADIPALYNDTSQSQDSRSIKPWTPSKLVITKADAAPVVIAVEQTPDAETDTGEEPEPEPTAAAAADVSVPQLDEIAKPSAAETLTANGGCSQTASKESQESSASSASISSVTGLPRPKGVSRELTKLQMDIVDADEYQVKTTARTTRLHAKRSGTVSPRPSPPVSVSPAARGRPPKIGLDAATAGSPDERDAHSKIRAGARRKSVDGSSSKSSSGGVEVAKRKTRQSIVPKADKLEHISEADAEPLADTAKDSTAAADSTTVEVDTEPASQEPIATPSLLDAVQPADAVDVPAAAAPEAEPAEDSPADQTAEDKPADQTAEEIESSQEPAVSPSTILQERRLARRSLVNSNKKQPEQTPATGRTGLPDTHTMDTLPMDTECADDVPELAQQVNGSRLIELTAAAAAKTAATLDAGEQIDAHADTESQASTLNITADVSMPDADTETGTDTASIPAELSADTETTVDAGTGPDDANATIRCSPEISDLEQRNAELLNDTLTISPIKGGAVAEAEEPALAAGSHSLEMSGIVDVDVADQPTAIATEAAPTVAPAPVAVCTPTAPTVAGNLSPPSVALQLAGRGALLSSTPQPLTGSPSSRYPQFKGRGAQLLNIIANKKRKPADDGITLELLSATLATVTSTMSNSNAAAAAAAVPSSATPSGAAVATADAHPESRDTFDDAQLPGMPTPKRNLLIFSKTLPSPLASPSSSILKRKLSALDADAADVAFATASPLATGGGSGGSAYFAGPSSDSCSTPVLKKKRVSFHDPPVSVTKEYISHADEHIERPTLNKLLAQQKEQQQLAAAAAQLARSPGAAGRPASAGGHHSGTIGGSGGSHNPRMRNVLRRKSRADSMVEFAKLNKMVFTNGGLAAAAADAATAAAAAAATAALAASTTGALAAQPEAGNTTADMEPLQWNSSTASAGDLAADGGAVVGTEPPVLMTTAELDRLIMPAAAAAAAADRNAMLQFCAITYSLEDVLAQFGPRAGDARLLTRELSALMRADERVCRESLDALSEQHPEQFLNHAIVENLGSTVCARLAPTVLLEHLRELAKTDATVHAQLAAMAGALPGAARATAAAAAAEGVAHVNGAASASTQTATATTTTTTTATSDVVRSLEQMLDAGDAASKAPLTDAQMDVMRRLVDRPLSDQQICDFMGIFSRNRSN